ncbi:MAG: hypothetical protein N3G22_03500 [Candidatus Micrarchaeota archaeon]|nr:hypothetical protein [Candidatus Micrarchaeota archaeon]
MNPILWAKEKSIYIIVFVLLLLLALVMAIFYFEGMSAEAARVYVQALSTIATLALLYYAYYNVISRQQEDIAHLELAVRPILVWELEPDNSQARFTYKTLKHPIYDLHISLLLGSKRKVIEERHLDVSESNPASIRKLDITDFLLEGLDGEKSGLLSLKFSYHSEVGGKYEFLFSKEVVKKPKGFLFQHRKIVSAKYPWRSEAVRFED